MMNHYWYCLFTGVVLFFSCSSSSPLELALAGSGKNRAELERVLTHFSERPEDSLKFKAAVFLIENMPGHYSLVCPEQAEYQQMIDSAFGNFPVALKKTMKLRPLYRPEFADYFTPQEDVSTLTADFLIKHIEERFAAWKSVSWLKGFGFVDFCEYILPYRIEKEEPVAPGLLLSAYYEEVRRGLELCDDTRHSPGIVAEALEKKTYFFPPVSFAGINMEFDLYTDCNQLALWEYWTCRSLNIPAAIDFLPCYSYKNNAHQWTVVVDKRFRDGFISTASQADRAARVYRKTYSHNPVPVPEKQEYVPDFFLSPFHRDVTAFYVPVADTKIRVDNPQAKKSKHIYLAVFNECNWRPVVWTERKGRHALFENMGRGVVYQPVYYSGRELRPASWPFLLDADGKIHQYRPDTNSLRSVKIVRKYPAEYRFFRNGLDFKGSVLLASNDSLFRKADTLLKVNEAPLANFLTLCPDSFSKYRYWKFLKPHYYLYPAEIEFYPAGSESPAPVRILSQSQGVGMRAVVDGDPLTYGKVYEEVGVDLGMPVNISKIRYLPRNDQNGIYPENCYELFYQDLGGWISLGQKVAGTDYLEYDNVPAEALLWLQNLTTGKEERIFTCENDEIRFW